MSRTTPIGLKICSRCQVCLCRSALRLRPEATAAIRSKRFASSSLSALTTTDPPDQIVDSRTKEWKLSKSVESGRKLRVLNGHLTRQSVANLETEALGEPAKVIILRDAMLDDSRSFVNGIYVNSVNQDVKSTEGKTSGMENPTVTKLLAGVEEERGIISQEDVNTNVEALRLQPATILSQEDFSKLADELCRGFTAAQLAGYTHAFEAKRSPDHSAEEKVSIDIYQTGWTPRATPKPKSQREKGATSTIVRSVTKKRRYAEHILRRCWGIQTEEEYESIGQINHLLGHRELSLLLRERNSLIQRFSETYNCQVSISRSRRTVRITGKRYDAQNLALALKKTVKSIACAEFDMGPFLPMGEGISGVDMIEKPTIEAISLATDTEIEPGEGRNKFNIYFWGWKTANLEKARRLLLAQLQLPTRAKSAVFVCPDPTRGVVALCRTEPGTELPLDKRTTQWSRWRLGSVKGDRIPHPDPVGDGKRPTEMNQFSGAKSEQLGVAQIRAFLQPVEPEDIVNNQCNSKAMKDEAKEAVDYKSVPTLVNLTKAGAQNSYDSDKNENQRLPATWSAHPVSSISVKLGQILHNTDGLSPVRTGQMKRLILCDNNERSFLTGLPGLPGLLRITKPLETTSRQYLAMRLVASPWMSLGLESVTKFPPVEISVRINEDTGEPQLSVVEAIVEERVADLMLPNKHADLRFSKRTKVTLLEPLLDKDIKEFVKSGELPADGTQPPGAPRNVELRIPKRLIWGDSPPDLELIDDGGEECALIQYILVGLDVQQRVQFEYNGWKVTYSDTNSGKLRGRRVELLMAMAWSTSEANGSKSELPDFSAFFDDAQRLATQFEPVAPPNGLGRQ